MKITIHEKDLKAVLRAMKQIALTRKQADSVITTYVTICATDQRVEFTALDGIIRLIATPPAAVQAAGSCAVDVRALYNLVKDSPTGKSITLAFDASRSLFTVITDEQGYAGALDDVLLAALPGYGALQPPDPAVVYGYLPLKPVQTALKQALPAVMEPHGLRPLLEGICLDIEGSTAHIVGADGYCLVHNTVPLAEALPPLRVVLPAKAARAIIRMSGTEDGRVAVHWQPDEQAITFETATTSLTCVSTGGDYPNWRGVREQYWQSGEPPTATITLSARALYDGLRQVKTNHDDRWPDRATVILVNTDRQRLEFYPSTGLTDDEPPLACVPVERIDGQDLFLMVQAEKLSEPLRVLGKTAINLMCWDYTRTRRGGRDSLSVNPPQVKIVGREDYLCGIMPAILPTAGYWYNRWLAARHERRQEAAAD